MSTHQYGKGFIPSSPATKILFGAREFRFGEVIPRADWPKLEFESYVPQVKRKNQRTFSACCGHATATSLEIVRAMAGMTHVPLSAWYPYSILCEGVDNGASIGDALIVAEQKGVAPETDVPYGTINPNLLTPQAKAEALRFRIDVGGMATTWDEIVSAVIRKQAFNLSVDASGWQNVDGEGVPPVGTQADHAITVGGGLKFSPRWGPLVKVWNSWDTDWGVDGCCWISERHVQVQYFECYHVTAAVDDPFDPSNPPNV